ncbi:phage Gp37/Gp68 family protein [Tistrella bauzanensis]|uniref:phage Gp37/Gp68 family protein n=1 Tax=Tistrella TaxID=171436 RepID=UPI0031F606CC
MADKTLIEWADATANAINGCSVISPGCKNCYAMRLAGTRLRDHPSRAGLTVDSVSGPVWTGEISWRKDVLLQVIGWKRPRRVFWNAHGDMFHDNVDPEMVWNVFGACALSPQHTHIILTKRPERMAMMMGNRGSTIAVREKGGNRPVIERPWPLPNVWIGVSVEDQRRADERVPVLIETPAAYRFVSAEPLLAALNLEKWLRRCRAGRDGDCIDARCPQTRDDEPHKTGRHCPIDTASYDDRPSLPLLDLVIAGGESGPSSRSMPIEAIRSLRDQCQAAGVPFHFKQWGDWAPNENGVMVKVGKKVAGRVLDGRTWDEVPSCL